MQLSRRKALSSVSSTATLAALSGCLATVRDWIQRGDGSGDRKSDNSGSDDPDDGEPQPEFPSRDLPDREYVADPFESEELADHSDRVLTSASEIADLPEEDPENTVIGIEQPDEPYGLDRELVFDVDGLTLLFQSPFTTGGDTVLRVADGANVGGPAFGVDVTPQGISDIEIVNLGYDGNYENQDQSVEHLNALTFDDVQGFAVRGAYIRGTSPHWRALDDPVDAHGPGGEGIDIGSRCSEYRIEHIHGEEIGDQLVQARGEDGHVSHITEIDGFDRTVSLSFCDRVDVEDVASWYNEDGAVVGAAGASDCSVSDVYAYRSRNAITMSNESERITVRDVLAEETTHTVLDVRNGSLDIDVRGIRSANYDTELRLGVQVNNEAGDLYVEEAEIHAENAGWFIDIREDSVGDVELVDVTLTGAREAAVNRAVRDRYGARYDGLTVDVERVGQGEGIYITDSSREAEFLDLRYDGEILDEGENTVIEYAENSGDN